MIAPTEQKHYTVTEYLELEVASETRSEYRNGEIVEMTGGTPNHNDIAGNFYILLKSALKGKAYRIFYTDQRLWIPDRNLYTYPDLMVVETPLQLKEGRTDTLVNPCFVAEVLSKSTQDYDRTDKFAAYRTINSFREYLLIDQYRNYIEHYVKTAPHQWLFSEYDDPSATLSLNTFDLQVQIADIYENIDFATT
jgi:Uma2 family endonuclease